MATQEELDLIEKNLGRIRYQHNDKKEKVILEGCQPFVQFISDRYDIFKDNFQIFARSGNAIMYPDEFIFAVSQIEGGNQLIFDNIDLILKLNNFRKNRLIQSLEELSGIEDSLALDFRKRFNLLVHGVEEQERKYDIDENFNSDIDLCNDDVAFRVMAFLRCILKNPNAPQILEENKDMLLTPRYNSIMPQIVYLLSERADLHPFVINNFQQILRCAQEKDIVKVYKSAQFVFPDEYERHKFVIEEIYDKAMAKIEDEKPITYYDDVKTRTDQVLKTCSRIIQQDKSEEIQKLTTFVAAASEKKSVEIVGLGAFSTVIKCGNKIVKVGSERGNNSVFEIPYHPRILKPIIRKKDVSTDPKRPLFIEVQDEVDTNSRITDEELLQVYKELRESGIKWCDAKKDNLGRLKRDNHGYPIGFGPPSNNQSLGLTGDDLPLHQALKAGELVVLDLDYLYPVDYEHAEFTQAVPDIIRRLELEFSNKEKKKKEAGNIGYGEI